MLLDGVGNLASGSVSTDDENRAVVVPLEADVACSHPEEQHAGEQQQRCQDHDQKDPEPAYLVLIK